MAVAGNLDVDHRLTVLLAIAYDQSAAWPTRVIPICINVIQHPLPTALHFYKLVQAIRRAVTIFDNELTVCI